MKTSAALAKKTGQETVIDRWYRSLQNPLFNPWVTISRLPILTMLDRGFFDIRRNGCIDPLPARSNDLCTDLVTEPLISNSNAKFDGRKFNWIGTANGIHDLPMLAGRRFESKRSDEFALSDPKIAHNWTRKNSPG